jgi:ADP-heptose:LPS heptosyltransferase
VILSYRPDSGGVFTKNLRRLSGRLVLSQAPFPPPPPPKVHVADYALNLLAELGVHPPMSVPCLPLTSTDQTLIQPFFNAHRIDDSAERLVVVHPGSGSEAKRWPLENFAALSEALAAEPRVRTVVVAGYAEAGVVDRLLPLLRDAKPLVAIDWPLPPTAALIAHAAVFVGHDSGLTHLAAAFGRPTVALFGPTDPEIWGPRGQAVTIVHMRPTPTDAHDQCPDGGPSPRARTDVRQTFAAVQRYLAVEAMQNPGDRLARS